ncbi:MAG TPA: class I SAM-dependent methyltransferase [Dongiaceae bacterium]|jgi:hypothetical protein
MWLNELGRRLLLLLAEMRQTLWRIRNPGKSFADYYSERIAGKLDRGRAHTTLGKRDRPRIPIAPGADLVERPHRDRGLDQFHFLQSLGFQPEHRCVDYGCGSLRIGMHLIDYLDRGNYWGVDITDRFYNDGLELLSPETVPAKAPRLDVIGPSSLAAIKEWRPDIVLSFSVMLHVPPAELQDYLAKVTGLLAKDARAIIVFDETATDMRLSPKSWSYSQDTLRDRLRQIDASFDIAFRHCREMGKAGRQVLTRQALIVTRR